MQPYPHWEQVALLLWDSMNFSLFKHLLTIYHQDLSPTQVSLLSPFCTELRLSEVVLEDYKMIIVTAGSEPEPSDQSLPPSAPDPQDESEIFLFSHYSLDLLYNHTCLFLMFSNYKINPYPLRILQRSIKKAINLLTILPPRGNKCWSGVLFSLQASGA